jgi:hypothetical protein
MKPPELPTLKKPKPIPIFSMLGQEDLMKIVEKEVMSENVQSKSTLNLNSSVIPTKLIETKTPKKTY